MFSASKDEAIITKYIEKALRKLAEKPDNYILVFAERFTIEAMNYLDGLGIKYIFTLSGPDTRTDQQYNDMKNHLDPHIK
ncbi:hypothetical protein D3C71_2063430 [compost metagenome]